MLKSAAKVRIFFIPCKYFYMWSTQYLQLLQRYDNVGSAEALPVSIFLFLVYKPNAYGEKLYSFSHAWLHLQGIAAATQAQGFYDRQAQDAGTCCLQHPRSNIDAAADSQLNQKSEAVPVMNTGGFASFFQYRTGMCDGNQWASVSGAISL